MPETPPNPPHLPHLPGSPIEACPQCHYSWRGLPEVGACPECGLRFNALSCEFRLGKRWRAIAQIVIGGILIFWTLASAGWQLNLLGQLGPLRMLIFPVASILLFFFVGPAFLVFGIRNLRHRGLREERVCLLAEGIYLGFERRNQLVLWKDIERIAFRENVNMAIQLKTDRPRPGTAGPWIEIPIPRDGVEEFTAFATRLHAESQKLQSSTDE